MHGRKWEPIPVPPVPGYVRILVASSLLVALVMVSLPSRARACVIAAPSASIDELQVSPGSEAAFPLRVRNLPLEVRPLGKGRAKVSLLSPLAFTTTHELAKLDIRLAKRTSLYDGRITLASGLAPSLVQDGSAQEGEVLAASLPLAEFRPEESLAIPCAQLTVAGELESAETPALVYPTHSIRYVLDPEHLPLYADRHERAPIWMSFRGGLQVLSADGSWMRVQARWSDGSSVQGWIPRRLATIHKGVLLQGVTGSGIGSLSACGRSHMPSLTPFLVRAGAPIHSRDGGPIWAQAATTIKVMAFSLSRSDGWIQIASIEGLPPEPCSEHDRFWVHASDIVWTDAPLSED